MDDLISRQWLMECVNEGWIKFDSEKDKNKFIHLVRDTAPSAEPERIRGRWEMKPDPYGFFDEIPVCSECGCTTEMRKVYKFCPNCGAEMRSKEDGE